MKRRLLALWMVTVMLLALLSGCGNAEEAPKTDNTTVTTTTTASDGSSAWSR